MSRDDHNEAAETVQVVYCSASQHRELPEHVCIRSTPRPSTAMCEHIYTVDKSRLGNFVGHLTPQEMQRLDIGIMVALDIGGGTEPENLRGGGYSCTDTGAAGAGAHTLRAGDHPNHVRAAA